MSVGGVARGDQQSGALSTRERQRLGTRDEIREHGLATRLGQVPACAAGWLPQPEETW